MPRLTRCGKLKVVQSQLRAYEDSKEKLTTDYFDVDIEVCKSEISFLNQLSCCKEEDRFRVGYNHNYELSIRDSFAEKYGLGPSDRVERAANLYGEKVKPKKKRVFNHMDEDNEYRSLDYSWPELKPKNQSEDQEVKIQQDQVIHKGNESIKKELKQNSDKALFFEVTSDSPLIEVCDPLVLSGNRMHKAQKPDEQNAFTTALHNNSQELKVQVEMRATNAFKYYRYRTPHIPKSVCSQAFSPSKGKLLMILADLCPHYMTLKCLCGKGVRFKRTIACPLRGEEGIVRVIGRSEEYKLLEVNPIWCDQNFYDDIHFTQELSDRLLQVALSAVSGT